MKSKDEQKEQDQAGGKIPNGPKVSWNTKNLKSSYANVCTMMITREEVVLNFGVNQAWEHSRGEMEIELNDRIILSPFAAQRLLDSLGRVMADYQKRYGKLAEDPTASPAPIPSAPAPETTQ